MSGYEPQKRYIQRNIRQVKFGLNRKTDADIIAHLESKDNIAGYLKELIRADMHKKPRH